ncbi:putative wd repeat-containing protein [Diaporthe ampelina]|uniref:Putative wd repeat-containing protein n=1 Tax=Diaporthe ampelina TaxID=1214573 RepID=A0A0G2HHM1_9PEZI|nr:putative wd repeat-containing protein [Diaporthe ampelina]
MYCPRGKDGQFVTLDVKTLNTEAALTSAPKLAKGESGLSGFAVMGVVQDQLVTIDSERSIEIWGADQLPNKSTQQSTPIRLAGQSDPVLGVQPLTMFDEMDLAFFTWSKSGKVLLWDLDGIVKHSFDIPVNDCHLGNEVDPQNQLCVVYELVTKQGEADSLAAIYSRSISLKASPVSMVLDSDCRSIFVSSLDRSICRFDIESGRQTNTFKCTDENGTENAVVDSLHFGPSKRNEIPTIIGISNTDKSVRVYDSQSGAFMDREWGHTESINGVTLVDTRKKSSAVSLRSSYGVGSLQTATEQTCRQLRTYRNKLSSAEPISSEAIAELETELRHTTAALSDRVTRDSQAVSESVLSGLLDQYSERLVSMLDERLRLRLSEAQFNGSWGSRSGESSPTLLTPSSTFGVERVRPRTAGEGTRKASD